MNLLHEQIELDFLTDSARPVSLPIDHIAHELRNYSDNGPFAISGPHLDQPRTPDSNLPSYDEFISFLDTLAEHKIIIYKLSQIPIKDPDSDSSITLTNAKIFITNRYRFEQLRKELVWVRMSKDKEASRPDYPANLLYYDENTGEMFFNGVHKTLKKRNKEIVDKLLLHSPNYVPRKKLNTIARRYSKEVDDDAYLTNNAFTNLRKVCGNASTDIIELNANGGRLNIATYPLANQTPPSDF